MADELTRPKESVWKRLTRLFRSGPVVRHKVASGEKLSEPKGSARAYKKELSSLYVHSLASYGQYERLARYADYSEMEFSVAPNTLIAIPGGFRTIKDLADECSAKRAAGIDDSFVVYSWDHSEARIVPALATGARKTRSDTIFRITFDDGRFIEANAEHRFMMRDATYRKVKELAPGMSMMPFKREHRFNSEYFSVYDGNDWVYEHRLLGSFLMGRELDSDEVVHHVNEKKYDNRLENLRVMTRAEHSAHHLREFNKLKWDPSNEKWIENFRKNHSRYMTENNPSARRDVTFVRILQVAEKNDFHLFKTMEAMDIDYPTIVRRLKEQSFKNWEAFAKSYSPGWKNHGQDNKGEKNPRWDSSLTFQHVCDAFLPGMRAKKLAEKLNTTPSKVWGRVKPYGFKSLADFCANYRNCKVVSIEEVGISDVYDLTVEGYKNFATDTIISHNTPELASGLDIFADESTAQDEHGKTIRVLSPDQGIREILETLFFDILNIEFNLWLWTRNLCKYGDFALFVDANEENGILNLFPIPINEIEREEGYDKDDPFAVRFRWLTQGNRILQSWQVVHFRLLGNDNFLPYGTSMIEPARRIWRQLILIEDAMLVYRIVRSPERRVFYVDVGGLPPAEIETFMEQVKTKLRRSQVIDPSSGRVDLRYNPLSVDEDFFIPTRGDRSSKIETLPGGQFVGDIEDVQYIQGKLFAALKIPKSYLSFEGEVGSKATLAQQDVRFARTIERIQKILISELNKIAIIHLFLLGYEGPQLVNFEIKMANPSTISLQQKLELWRSKFEIAGTAAEGILDRETIYRKIFDLTDEEIEKIREGKKLDKLEDLYLESVQLPADAQPAGAPVPGEEELPQTLGGPEGGEAPAGEEAPVEPPQEARELAGDPVRELVRDDGVTEKRNPGSEGNNAFIGGKGHDLFAPAPDLYTHAFGTKKQTASDPADLRYLRRTIRRPFSEDSEDMELSGADGLEEREVLAASALSFGKVTDGA